MRNISRKLLILLILIVFAFTSAYVTLINLGITFDYSGGDIGPYFIYPIKAFLISLYTWYEEVGPGRNGELNSVQVFPFLAVIALIKLLGVANVLIPRILFMLYLFLSGISMFYLLKYLMGIKTNRDVCIIGVAGFLYMFNHYTMILLSHPVALGAFFIFYVVAPVMLLFFIKGLKDSKQGLNSTIYLSFLSVFLFLCNISHIIVIAFISGMYFLWSFYADKEILLLYRLKFICMIIMLSFAFNVHKVLLMGSFYFTESVNFGDLFALGDVNYLNILCKNCSLGNLIRFCGESWASNQDVIMLKPLHDSMIYEISSYLVPTIALSAFIFYNKDKRVLFFCLLTIIGLFLSKGINPPFSTVFLWCYRNIPGFSMLRNTYDKLAFIVVFSVTILFAFGLKGCLGFIDNINMKWNFKKNIKIIGGGALILGIFIPSSLLWQGKVVRWPNFLVKVPDYYENAAEYLKKDKEEFKVLSLPMSFKRMVDLKWGYMGQNILEFQLNKPVLEYSWFAEHFTGWQNWILKGNPKRFLRLLKYFNVKYILLNNDSKTSFESSDLFDTKQVLRFYDAVLKRYKIGNFVTDIKKFNNVVLSRISNKYFMPHIYAAERTSAIEDNIEMDVWDYLLDTECFENNSAIIFSVQNIKRSFKKKAFLKKMDNLVIRRPMSACHLKNINADTYYLLSKDYLNENIYLNETGDYRVELLLKPEYKIYKSIKDKNISLEPALWHHSANNVNYEYFNGGNNTIIISVEFDGASTEDEYAQFKKEDLDIDLNKFPFLEVTYKLQNPEVQIIEFVAGIDINNDEKVDYYLRGLFKRLDTNRFFVYRYNALEKLKDVFPGIEYFRVKELEVYPHKMWNVDCSKELKGEYCFWIKDLKFLRYSRSRNFIKKDAVIDERFILLEKDSSSQIKGRGFKVRHWKIIGEEMSSSYNKSWLEVRAKGNMTLTRELNGVSVREYPLLDLNLKSEDFANQQIVVFVEFSKGRERSKNKQIIKIGPLFVWDHGLDVLRINLLREFNKQFPNERDCFMERIILEASGNNNLRENIWYFRSMKIFNIKYINKNYNDSINLLNIDEKMIDININLKSIFDKGKIIIKNKYKLGKGNHRVKYNYDEYSNYKIEKLFLYPKKRNNKHNAKNIVMRWQKINPTKYIIDVQASSPFWLVFNDSYHVLWNAYICRTGSTTTSINEAFTIKGLFKYFDKGKRLDEHYLVNGYANGWYIPADNCDIKELEKGGEFRVIIEYIPQRWFVVGLSISLIFILITIIYMCYRAYRRY